MSLVPAGRWPFPTLSLQPLHRCLDPYPVVPPRCSCPFLPEEHRPYIRSETFGTPRYSCIAVSAGHVFRGCSHSITFRLPCLLGPQAAPTASPICDGRPGRLRHASLGWLPAPSCGIATCLNRAIDMPGLSPVGLQPCRLLRLDRIAARTTLGFGGDSTGFPVGLSPTPIVHVSASPRCHPGRSDFPSPVGDHGSFPSRPSQQCRSLSAGSHTPLTLFVYLLTPHRLQHAMLSRALRPVMDPSDAAMCRKPLCPIEVLLFRVQRLPLYRKALPLHLRSYGLMRQTKSLPLSSALASIRRSLQVVASPCW